jgi:hypothetical protein
VDVPPSIGPVVFGVGVGWVTIRCPRQYDELMRRAGGVWYRPRGSWWRRCTAHNYPFGYRAGIARPTKGSALERRGAVLQRDGDRNGVA